MRIQTFVRCAVVCVVAIVFASAAVAAETGNATGRVVDAVSNAGIEGVVVIATCTVEYEEDQPYARVETVTAADGTYTLRGLLADAAYSLSFTKVGYVVGGQLVESQPQRVVTAAGKTKRINEIVLLSIPTAKGAYLISADDGYNLRTFLEDAARRPDRPITYTSLLQAMYQETPILEGNVEPTRKFFIHRDAVIPTIEHRQMRNGRTMSGVALFILSDFDEEDTIPLFYGIREFDSTAEERSYIEEGAGWNHVPHVFIAAPQARAFIAYTDSALTPGPWSLPQGRYAILCRCVTVVRSYLFEVVDIASENK